MSENSANSQDAFNYDIILEHVGLMGKFQILVCFWLCIPVLFAGSAVMNFSFTGAIPRYGCLVEGCDNATTQWLNKSSLRDQSSSCYRYHNQSDERCQPYEIGKGNSTLSQKCENWVYDASVFESTLTTEFDLICDNEHQRSMVDAMFMAGMFVAGITLSYIADIIGRKLALTISCLFFACFMTGSAFVPNVTTFAVFRFFCGLCAEAIFAIAFIWAVEVTGTKYRIVTGFLYQIVFTFGECFMGLSAYFIRDWRRLQLVTSAPIFVLVIICWCLPESIRWLITMKRYDEARRLINRASKMNGASVPLHLTATPNKDADGANSEAQKQTKENLLDVLRITSLRNRIILLFCAWFACIVSFYGIGFSLHSLPGSFFLNYQLVMLVELPAYIIGGYFINRTGRRIAICGSIVSSGIACLCIGFVPDDPPIYRICLALVGKLFVTFSFGGLYLYTSELFPTTVRSSVIGACSTIGRIGGVFAPFIANEGVKIDPTLPFITFAAINIVSGLLGFLLPETNNVPLPSTMQEADDLRNQSILCCKGRAAQRSSHVEGHQ